MTLSEGVTELQAMMPTVRQQLRESLLVQEGLYVLDVVIEKIINRPFSDVIFLRVITSVGERRVVLKKTAHHPANRSITERQNQAVVEYDILMQLYPKFLTVPRCRVPKPILVIPEHEAYVMEYVDGRVLGDLFVAARYFAPKRAFEELMEYYYLNGVWLKNLHEFTGVHRAGREAFEYSLERCEQKLMVIEEAQDFGCPPDFVNYVRSLLNEQLNLVKDEDILVTGRHGDFGSWNIMASTQGITVFDFLGYQNDLLPIDLLKMLTNFEDEYTYLIYSNSRINTLKKAFMEGYGNLGWFSKPIATLCEALHRVCCLSARASSVPEGMRRRMEHRSSLKKHLSWFMNKDRKLLLPENRLS